MVREKPELLTVPEAINDCWSMDFMHDQLTDGRTYRLFNVIDDYNRTIRYDWLSHYLFDSIAEIQDSATRWLWTYNNERPNMALGGITPKQKVAMAA